MHAGGGDSNDSAAAGALSLNQPGRMHCLLLGIILMLATMLTCLCLGDTAAAAAAAASGQDATAVATAAATASSGRKLLQWGSSAGQSSSHSMARRSSERHARAVLCLACRAQDAGCCIHLI